VNPLRETHAGLVAQITMLQRRMAELADAEARGEAHVLEAIQHSVDRVCEAANVAAKLAEELAADGRLVKDGGTDGVKRRLAELRVEAGQVLVALSKLGEANEKRVARLVRATAQTDMAARKAEREVEELSRSRDPRDQVKLVLGAIDELPVDLAFEVITEAQRRTKAREA
jgi:hypothetical protein